VKGVFGDCQFTCFPDCQLALPPDSAKNLFLLPPSPLPPSPIRAATNACTRTLLQQCAPATPAITAQHSRSKNTIGKKGCH